MTDENRNPPENGIPRVGAPVVPQPGSSSRLTVWRVLFCMLLGLLGLAVSVLLICVLGCAGLPPAFFLCYGFYLALDAAWNDRQRNQPWPWYQIPVSWAVNCWDMLRRMVGREKENSVLGCFVTGCLILLSLFLLLFTTCVLVLTTTSGH